MVKCSDLLKVLFVLQILEFCCTMPLSSDEPYYVSVDDFFWISMKVYSRIFSQYDQDYQGVIPLAAISQPNYWPMSPYQPNHIYPTYNDNFKSWLVPPSKRNSELINSLLGLPKNMESAGK